MWSLLILALAFCPDETSFANGKEHIPGFFDLFWDASEAELYLSIDQFEEPFLLIHSLVTGLGSNDVGLDRGQMNQEPWLVSFKRIGKRVYLIRPNSTYRALTDNQEEKAAVRDSFAYGVIWSAPIEAEWEGKVVVSLSSLVFADRYGIGQRLKESNEGNYQLSEALSYYHMPRTKSFPKNTEVEVALTFTGQPEGRQVTAVSADARHLTMQCRYSFIQLPDLDYQPRRYHPKAGGFTHRYRDYAAPLDADLDQFLMNRHRLQLGADGKVIEPIIYYVDSGAPPRIRQALIEGASWWAEAFDAAGFKDGFQVKVMPEGMDPMDVRHNVIQWVHRSTRGWSYGSAVSDPRTGEILKGHVTLGSLRVRQDRILFEGMLARDENGAFPEGQDPVELALARIRQLSAHEVGHTLGLAHNFAASGVSRASVMDYPAPLVRLKDGKVDTSDVYDRGIGEWDKISVHCLYGNFKDEMAGMNKLIADGESRGIFFIADEDSRSLSSMHPSSHLWDNGSEAVGELERVIELREHLLRNFGTANLAPNHSLARLEEVLVPVYLHHRFQVQAAGKLLGGADFDYGFNDGKDHYRVVEPQRQKAAFNLLMKTLSPEFLDLPKHLRSLIPPRPPHLPRHREMFDRRTADAFDELALPETSAAMTLAVMLDASRLNRVFSQHLDDASQPGIVFVLDTLLNPLTRMPQGREGVIQRQVNHLTVNHLMELVKNPELREEVRALVYHRLLKLNEQLAAQKKSDDSWQAHFLWLKERLSTMEEEYFIPSRKLTTPPGSPI